MVSKGVQDSLLIAKFILVFVWLTASAFVVQSIKLIIC